MELWVLIDSANTKLAETIDSIKKNTKQPNKIVDAHELNFIDALKGVKNTEPTKTNVWLLSVSNPIPPHLIAHYIEFISMSTKPCICGLAGFIMHSDRNITMDTDFKALTENRNYTYDRNCKISVVRNNAVYVHWIERFATMLIPRDIIDGDFFAFPMSSLFPELSLCNYVASKGIQCIQICNLGLNVIMMEKLGYIEHVYGTVNLAKKENDVNAIVRQYQELNKFFLWEKQVPEYFKS